jgi:hypothetical protein
MVGDTKMTKYKVYGIAMNRETRKPVLIKGGRKIRGETIDTEKNEIFNGKIGSKCHTVKDVEERYEAFWNDMNPHSQEIVKVVGIKKIK